MTDAERQDAEILQMAQLYARVFGTPDGRTVLADMAASYQTRSSFVGGDPHATAFREGQRAVYLAIRQLLAKARNPKEALTVVGGLDEDL